jgi:ABC-type branched-subunit amino acid transport system ATPase component
MTTALDVQNLCSGYGRIPILSGVQFQLAPREVLGILGHNGMGKTTLLRTVMGYVRATSGRIRAHDADITDEPTYRRANFGLGYVPQGRQIFPNLSAYDNLRVGCAAAGGQAVIDEVLIHFARLRRLLNRSGGTLSGGEQQLLALARCLCGSPKIMLLDEPSEGIQPSILDEIAAALGQIKATAGTAIVLVEQNVEFLSALADRVLIMHRGRIVAELPGSAINIHTMDQHVM